MNSHRRLPEGEKSHHQATEASGLNGRKLVTPNGLGAIIFDTPPEIRLDIYKAALMAEHDGLSLLSSCKHVNQEAQEVLYQRPASFTSQAKLFDWIERSSRPNLQRVRTLTLRLTDVDLTPLLVSIDPSPRQTRSSAWALYHDELQQLDDALSSLTKLSVLTVIPPRLGRSEFLKNLYHSFLAAIPKRCRTLKRLELHDSEDVLEAVPSLANVPVVTFSPSAREGLNVTKQRIDSATDDGYDTLSKCPKRTASREPPTAMRRARRRKL